MQIQVHEIQGNQIASQRPSPGWVHHVIALLDSALDQLSHEQAAHDTLLRATSLLRRQVDTQHPQGARSEGKERLLSWQVRKLVEHIDRNVTQRVSVADLSALVQRSEAHFSRSFRRTFGQSPHAFVVQRRVWLAAQYMLETDTPLSDIALRCGFVDQAHLRKHFRKIMGETPAAWRRARRVR